MSDLISFARGAPSADLLPVEAVREAAQRALTEDGERALSYGTGYGHEGLREWIAERHGVAIERVMITNGSLEAVALLFEHLVERGARVAVEQPSYDRTLLMLRRLGAELVPVPLEADGLDPGALEEAAKGGLALAHVIPNFHNPAGCTLAAEKRERVLALAEAYDFAICEDDPYREVWFEAPPPATMLAADATERVVYTSSFSKTISPGVRIGYVIASQTLVAELAQRANETYISPNMLAESVAWELCRSGGLDANVAVVREALADRRDALCAALRERIPEAEFVSPGGGYFLWATLGEDVDAAALEQAAREEGVAFVKGADFMLEGGRSSLRFSFASVPVERIDEGIAGIARALDGIRAAV